MLGLPRARRVRVSILGLGRARRHSARLHPITDATTMLVRSRAPQGDEGYEALTDKSALLDSAVSQGVPAPTGSVAQSSSDAAATAARLRYPVILKPARSKALLGDRIVSTSVRRVHDQGELERALESAPWFPAVPVIVQEFIPGHGAGVFCLYDRDHAVAWFAHRRIREKPPSGGVSVLCESVAVDPVLKEYAERLLPRRRLPWRGHGRIPHRHRRPSVPDGGQCPVLGLAAARDRLRRRFPLALLPDAHG